MFSRTLIACLILASSLAAPVVADDAASMDRRALGLAQQAEAMRATGRYSRAADAVRAARDAAMEEQSAQMAALVDERSELQSRLDQLGGALTEASARPDFKLAEAAHSGIVEPLTLWELEKARAERRWRHAVATNPESDPSPFDEPGVDPVRLAIEVEAAALREEVGAFITVDWQAEPITDPARCHLILRVAQEILASAAREPEATRLLISGDDEISMKLTAADEGNEVINLIAPRIPSDLVDISDQNGLDIVVRAK